MSKSVSPNSGDMRGRSSTETDGRQRVMLIIFDCLGSVIKKLEEIVKKKVGHYFSATKNMTFFTH